MKTGWEYKKLGEVVQYFTGNRPSGGVGQIKEGALSLGGEHIGKDGYIDLSTAKYVPQDFYTVNTKGHIFDGDVLMCKDGALTGKLALVRNELNGLCSMVNEHVFILRSVFLTHPYLFYFLFSNNGQTQIKNRISGAAQGGLNSTNLKSIQIPVPPLPTQQSIVSELDSLSKIIADCKETLKDYDALEQSIFYDMFGDPVKNEKGWEVKKLEDICSNIVDCPHSTPTKSDVPTIYPCIRTSELRNGEIYWDSMQYVEEEEYKNRIVRLQPQKDDIVFGREGSIGGAVILPEGYQFCLGQRTMLLRVDESIIHSIFLHRVILSDWVKNQIMDKNVASTVAHVNVKDVKAFLIPVPPLPLQQQFASKIEAIEQMKSETKKALQEAETLFQARMDYWFN